jgi:PAS domain S-box-containing protein
MSEKIRALLACPIILRDEVVGIFYIDDFKPRQFYDRQKTSLNLLAGLTGVCIDRFSLIRKIEDLELKALKLTEFTNDMVFITDPAGLITYFNERATDMLGYPGHSLDHTRISMLIKENLWDVIKEEIDSKSVFAGYEVPVVGADGREIVTRLNAVVLKDPEGVPLELIFMLGSLKTESELQKTIEDKTRELEDLKINLEKKVVERTRELEKINNELEYANQLKGRFIANMSHELRTPLNSIIGFSDVLLDMTFGTLTENQERYIKNIYTSGKHLLELINNVLDIAKIEAGKFEMMYETFLVDDVISEVINIMKSLAEKKFLEILVSIGEGVSAVTADRVKLKQILYNLLSNAIKFTPEGGKVKVDFREVVWINILPARCPCWNL